MWGTTVVGLQLSLNTPVPAMITMAKLCYSSGAEHLSGTTRFMATWLLPTWEELGRASNTTPPAQRARCRAALRRGECCLCFTLRRGTSGLSVLIVKMWTKNSDTQELPCDRLTGLTCRRSRALGGWVAPAYLPAQQHPHNPRGPVYIPVR